MSNFDTLLERELERFQTGGFCVGDRVFFKKDAMKHDYIKNRAQSFQDMIAACMDPGFDLNLRIGAIKSIYPTTTQNYGNGTEAPTGTFFDIYIEYAPGLFRNPITVPCDVVDVFEDSGRGPVPDSVVRKNKVHGPQDQETEQNNNAKGFDVNLTNKNVVIPGGNKWDDSQPGGGNF
jgi:hypothetical protein